MALCLFKYHLFIFSYIIHKHFRDSCTGTNQRCCQAIHQSNTSGESCFTKAYCYKSKGCSIRRRRRVAQFNMGVLLFYRTNLRSPPNTTFHNTSIPRQDASIVFSKSFQQNNVIYTKSAQAQWTVYLQR